MNLRTFSASTMAEALRQVKTELGGDALILHTRTFYRRRWLGLRRQEVVEITAGRGTNLSPRRRSRPPAKPAPSLAEYSTAQMAMTAKTFCGSSPARAAAAVADPPVGKRLLDLPAANSAMMMGISNEMSELKTMVADLVRQQRSSQAPNVPEELLDHYTQLIQNQVTEELAADLVKTIRLQLRPEHLKNSEFVREKLSEQLEKLLPVSGPITRTKTVGPHVVALIGPTGVGKTTTIAKLAANLRLRQNQRVGLITIDTYRIAAVDQLKKYADIIGSPLRVVSSPEDLAVAVAAMVDCDYVLIDTAGRSPTDTMKLQELKGFLSAANPDEVHLVLSTTASQECIESAVARFGDVRVDKIIFTKLDEAVHVGTVLNVIRKVNKQLSYITTGQDVPDDIEVGQGRRLAQLILGSKQ